jgi:misacylated tRNA(Ala) deacylase
MARYFCHDHPEVLSLTTEVVDQRPGAVLLKEHPFYPGGGGQLADRGTLCWEGGSAGVTGFENFGGKTWLTLDAPVAVNSAVEALVEPVFRQMMRELHTDLHILNALVFQHFDGALVTGVQMNDDGSARIDFDLPEADNKRLRALEPAINDMIRKDLGVSETYMQLDDAYDEKGLIRSRSVAPPPLPDGTIRIVEIAGIDRQACGGTHLASTGASRPVRILKIDNKGRHNRRIRIGLQGL